DARVLELAADLRLFDEPADQLRIVAVDLEPDLDNQLATQVGVARLEDGAHAAPGNLAEELEPGRAGVRRRHLGRGGPGDGRGTVVRVSVAEQDGHKWADRLGQRGQDTPLGGHRRPGV